MQSTTVHTTDIYVRRTLCTSLDLQLHLHQVLVLVLRRMRVSGSRGAVAGAESGARKSDDRHALTIVNWTERMGAMEGAHATSGAGEGGHGAVAASKAASCVYIHNGTS